MTDADTERERWRPRLTDEEILRGRRHGDGKFNGPLVQWHPNDEHHQRIQAILRNAQELLQESVAEGTRVLLKLIKDEQTPPNVRLRAIEVMYERVFGKAPQTVNLHMDTPFERLMMGLVLRFTGGEEASVIDTTESSGIIWEDDI